MRNRETEGGAAAAGAALWEAEMCNRGRFPGLDMLTDVTHMQLDLEDLEDLEDKEDKEDLENLKTLDS